LQKKEKSKIREVVKFTTSKYQRKTCESENFLFRFLFIIDRLPYGIHFFPEPDKKTQSQQSENFADYQTYHIPLFSSSQVSICVFLPVFFLENYLECFHTELF